MNESIDLFVASACARNLPLTFDNHPEAPHVFDLWHDSDRSREIIARAIEFMKHHAGSPRV